MDMLEGGGIGRAIKFKKKTCSPHYFDLPPFAQLVFAFEILKVKPVWFRLHTFHTYMLCIQ